MRTEYRTSTLLHLSGLTASLMLCGCQKDAVPPAPPPTGVSVVTVLAQSIEESLEFVGEVEASRTVRVRPQVSGVIMERPFREGTEVRSGDVLYRIEATTYEADHRSARFRLAEAEAELANAVSTVGRLRPLLADNAVARQEVDDAETAVKQAAALVEQARAAADQTRKRLSETVVRAEIAGRVGLALLDVGTRVNGPADVLTTIDVVDPIYVSFRPSTQQQFRWKRDPALSSAIGLGGSARLRAVLPDSTLVPFAGRIGFIDPVVDPQTGTQQYRAEFSNPARLRSPSWLLPSPMRSVNRWPPWLPTGTRSSAGCQPSRPTSTAHT